MPARKRNSGWSALVRDEDGRSSHQVANGVGNYNTNPIKSIGKSTGRIWDERRVNRTR
jgi:hypothetical protein